MGKNLLEFYFPKNISPQPDIKVFRYMSKIYGLELTNISKPCSLLKLVKYYKDIQKLIGINDRDVSEFIRGIKLDYNVQVYKDKYTVILLIGCLHYLRKGNEDLANMFFKFMNLKFYSSIAHKHFPKFCNNDIWSLSIDALSIKHLFKVHKGIGNAIVYIADDVFKNKKRILEKENLSDKELSDTIYYCRTRIAQSFKSFANMYYKISEDKGISRDDDISREEVQGVRLTAEKISMLICVYNQIDKKALNKAISNSGIRKDTGVSIVNELSTSKYKEDLNFIIILTSRVGELNQVCIERNRNLLLRKMYSNNKIANKYILKNVISKMLYSFKIGHQLRSIYKDQLIVFFSQYLTLYLRNRIC